MADEVSDVNIQPSADQALAVHVKKSSHAII